MQFAVRICERIGWSIIAKTSREESEAKCRYQEHHPFVASDICPLLFSAVAFHCMLRQYHMRMVPPHRVPMIRVTDMIDTGH